MLGNYVLWGYKPDSTEWYRDVPVKLHRGSHGDCLAEQRARRADGWVTRVYPVDARPIKLRIKAYKVEHR